MVAILHQWLIGLMLCVSGPGCVGGPDELELLYGHTFAGDQRLGEMGGGGWPIEVDDSDYVGIGLTWLLKPREVVVRNPVPPARIPEVEWTLRSVEPEPEPIEVEQNPRSAPPEPTRQEPTTPPKAAPTPTEAALEDIAKANQEQADAAGKIADAADTFNAYDWLTRVLLALLAGWILFIYRKQIGRLIPGSGKGNGEAKPCPPVDEKPKQ